MAWVKTAHIKGPKGAIGAKGATGGKGTTGGPGSTGLRGDPGPKGHVGARGNSAHISAAQGDRYYALKAHTHTAAQIRPTVFNGTFVFPRDLSMGGARPTGPVNVNDMASAAGGYLEVHWGQVAHIASALKHKKNIVDMDREKALDLIRRVPVSEFNFIDGDDKARKVGVIAEEMFDTYPDMILTDVEDGPIESFRYEGLIPELVAVAQLLLDRIDALEAR